MACGERLSGRIKRIGASVVFGQVTFGGGRFGPHDVTEACRGLSPVAGVQLPVGVRGTTRCLRGAPGFGFWPSWGNGTALRFFSPATRVRFPPRVLRFCSSVDRAPACGAGGPRFDPSQKHGGVAEWRGTGLQSQSRGFDSRHHFDVTLCGWHALIAQRIEQVTSNHQVRGSIPRGGTEDGTRRPGGFDSRRQIALLCKAGPRRRVSLSGLDSPVGILEEPVGEGRLVGFVGVRPKRTGSGLQNHRLRVRGPPPLRPCSSDGRAFD